LALLRGINVGGKTLISMAELKACTEGLGFANVSTYIASGNLLFTSEKKSEELELQLERAIDQRFGLSVKVVALDRTAYARIMEAIPRSWIGDEKLRANVAFVARGTDAREVVRGLDPDPAVDEIRPVDGAILWATTRNALNRSVMRKLIGRPAYKQVTVRSLNTALELSKLLDASNS
jgi:uncharacterized protein (DUF1697 family)